VIMPVGPLAAAVRDGAMMSLTCGNGQLKPTR
jgi:hypothetical protein